MSDDSVELVVGRADADVALTCEHASDRFPPPYELEGDDRRLLGTHWAVDLGARELTLELAAALGAPAVLSRCSRLVIDVNRDLGSTTLFRDVADDLPIAFNRNLSDDVRRDRIDRFHAPYHAAIDAMLARCGAPLVFAVHSFTDRYEGEPRAMEIGVLFDREQALADELIHALRIAGFVTAANEPWSGKAGLIYSADRHASAHGRHALEIEVRQDLCADRAFRARLVPVLVAALTEGARRARARAARG